jgi:hypothetical protein
VLALVFAAAGSFCVTTGIPWRRAGMWTLIRNGGVAPMLFILLTGLIGLGAAFHFALRARKQSLGFIRAMAMATLFGTLAASCADVGATLYTVEKSFDKSGSDEAPPGTALRTEAEGLPHALHLVVAGLAESTSPGILGFSFLALTSMLAAVGRRRLDERTP